MLLVEDMHVVLHSIRLTAVMFIFSIAHYSLHTYMFDWIFLSCIDTLLFSMSNLSKCNEKYKIQPVR